ncbi:MAG: DUF262 domain-containing HNH endonuclease family protein [Thermoanaerobaculia bacterium]
MARTNLLNTRTTNFLELIGNGRIYRVPAFQRDYSWEEEQWEDLWNDLMELRHSPDDRHYMGALVVEGKSDREFSIIDGQQRLATLSVLALAVIARLEQVATSGLDPDANRERAQSLRNRFVGEKDPASLQESSKLFLNKTDDGFYQDYLVQLRQARNPRALPKSNRLLWDCFQYFSKRLGELGEIRESGAALAALLSETVARQLMFILITVDDELNAYTVFETLNARGLELSATDLLKNYLFSKVRVSSDLEALQRRWSALIATVRQERFPEFLRYHLSCELPKVRSTRLFKIVRDRVRDPEAVFELMAALEPRAELYSALGDPSHSYWAEIPECRPYVRELVLFRVSQMTPLLFAARERLDDVEFTKVFKLTATISFRYSVVSDLNSNALEPAYHEAAKGVLDGSLRSAARLFQQLRSIYVSDERFEQDFGRFIVDTTGQRKKLAKYILAKLETKESGRACDPETDPATIEHVLPENPASEWGDSFPREQWESSTYRLGNLTLLELGLNRTVANQDFKVKKEAYAKSSYSLTRALAQPPATEWTPVRLEERQFQLAKSAAKIWRADYP